MADSLSEAGSAEAEDHVVFMCTACGLPFGDSGDLQEDLNEENIILLRGITNNVEIDATKAVSSYNLDCYSTVQILYCKGCSASIGTLYISTPRHLEYKRELFSLNRCAITCYSFNEASKQRARGPQDQVTYSTVSFLETQLKKCRTVLGHCARSLSLLENCVDELLLASD
ncbi:protein Mis18-alpha-like isoform X2 [Phyllobates terribilis]|uniref:protein Mis18-alpha-like isoform X2 n=1 Tax=Phyllobates terribilis TaxID=111132 RepID=UPI003CCAA6F1